jgi:hypothetical protein
MTVDNVLSVLMAVVAATVAVFFAVGGYPAPLLSIVAGIALALWGAWLAS